VPERPGRPDAPIDLLVVGHTNLDRFLDVRELPGADRTVPIVGARTELGGTAANIARSAASWGVASAVASRVGEDFPEEFVRTLTAAGVDVRGLERVPGARSPCCTIVEDGRGSQFTLIDQGAMADGADARVPLALIRASSWVHLTTGPVDLQLRVLDAARRLGRPVSADPAQEVHYRWKPGPLERLVRGSEILFGNESEVSKVMDAFGSKRPEELLEAVPLIVMTRGPKGARAYARSGTCDVEALAPRRIRQVTGAGDAFRGGFYAAWFSGQPLERCLVAGVRSSRIWIESGAGPARPGSARARPG
jgi:sugar/nucleoside kinase (ribokinase family)